MLIHPRSRCAALLGFTFRRGVFTPLHLHQASIGTVTYVPDKDAIVWSIKQFYGSREYRMRAHFGLPESRMILCAISFGIGDADHPVNRFRTARADLSDILDPRD